MEWLSGKIVLTLMERGPVVLVTTSDGKRDNVMTVSWTMVTGYNGTMAMTTGAWNYSYEALVKTRECVIAVPAVELLDTVLAVGTCSGADIDKFATFNLTRREAKRVRAPLIQECLANIECQVTDVIDRHNVVLLEAIAVHVVAGWETQALFHAVGDGTFIVDGPVFDRKEMMRTRLPRGF